MISEDAIIWFVNRFIHSQQSRDFVLQMHNLMPKTKDKKARWSQYVARNQPYMLDFAEHGRYLLVIPTTSSAQWARGKIWHSQTGYHYRTSPENNLFTTGTRS